MVPYNKYKLLFIEFQLSKITLKLKGNGQNNILGGSLGYTTNEGVCNFAKQYYPDEIYINRVLQNIVNYSYYFNETNNFIELIWYNRKIDCVCMFHECSNITEIDLSNFNTSEVTSMYRMFFHCSSLISINLLNVNTSKVKNMRSMFNGCPLLISLNLSNFDTSQVT